MLDPAVSHDPGSAIASQADWQIADHHLRRIARRRGRLDVDEARWLLVARRTGADRHTGCASFREYLERVLGYGPRTARDRIHVAETLAHHPGLRAAMESGELGFSAVRELARVIVRETEGAWIIAATGKTVREIEDLVAGRAPGDLPGEPLASDVRPRMVQLLLRPETYALWREAERALAGRTGHPVDDDALGHAMASSLLADGGSIGDRAPHQIAVTVCQHCRRGWQDGAGVTVELSPAAIAVAECDAERIGSIDGEVVARATQDFSPATRRLVHRRHHGRCAVPGCRNTRNLHIHHLEARAGGGDGSAANAVLLCGGHHRAYHDGMLAITGRWPDLRFALAHVGRAAEPTGRTWRASCAGPRA